ncbi:tRNA glutamyl-Q(34) synthetase GluQRS [Marinobacter zhejiangensis]|uniref:Glutamyl-Q tRNA(Asp) synthetase n=1 Tax=Marinobacter zhejiangensis TaxID=488535 RepID=A0A1I4MIH5_9GAMM|nr:tRNA glutamyl-Q(34) synthetase GluQRS [Marinobacter zhejiangensis]SFM02998.1 glutamyl-Q tRNA(Asp) synthetase [Marinobacter zhejiangensis]
MPTLPYRGRFAPSPTGPLHFGSLVTALASFLEARTHNGRWLVRIEDLDPLRESQTATTQILESLDAHQLHSDEPIRFQSNRHEYYEAAILRLQAQGNAYPCLCSRKQLKENSGHTESCQQRAPLPAGLPHAIRFALENETFRWQDELLGLQTLTIHAGADDPVIKRKEGFYAYQLAVVVDDIDQGISHVVRGSDLLDTTGQQQQIYRALNAPLPSWLHIPVILNEQGQKLSKQTHAPALDDSQPARNLIRALAALGQQPPPQLHNASVTTVLEWATLNWQPLLIPRHPHPEQPHPEQP